MEIVFEDGRPWLAGHAVHCGDVLDLFLPGRGWTLVRVELAWPANPDGEPVWVWLASDEHGLLDWGLLAHWPGR